jgi:hypothetical protein
VAKLFVRILTVWKYKIFRQVVSYSCYADIIISAKKSCYIIFLDIRGYTNSQVKTCITSDGTGFVIEVDDKENKHMWFWFYS